MPLNEIDRTALRQAIQSKALAVPAVGRMHVEIINNQQHIARLQQNIESNPSHYSNSDIQSDIDGLKARNKALFLSIEQHIPL